jgi:hypothetical protein
MDFAFVKRPEPKIAGGYMYMRRSTIPTISSAVPAATLYVPFYFPYDTAIKQVGIKVTATSSSSGGNSLGVGIYDSDNYAPKNLLFSAFLTTNSLGIQTVSCSVSINAAALYWVALYNPYGTYQNYAQIAHIDTSSEHTFITLGYKINYDASTNSYSITDSSCNYVLLSDQYAGSAMRDPSPSINTSAASYTNQQYPIIFLYEGLAQQNITFNGTAHYDGSYYYGQGTP